MSFAQSFEDALDAARASAPPPIDPDRADRMIAIAVAARHQPVDLGAPRPWAVYAAAAAALGIAFAAGAWWTAAPARPAPVAAVPAPAPTEDAPPEAPAPVAPELLATDRLSVGSGTRYFVRGAPGREVIELDTGALLVDAGARGRGESLSVLTPFGTARVIGTVFSVSVDDDRAVVRVYEGRVVVVAGGEERELTGGGALAVGADGFAEPPAPSADERALAGVAAIAVEARGAPPSVELDPPAEPPAVEPVPAPPSRPPRPSYARLWIAHGQPARAVSAAERAILLGYHEPTWRMVEGDGRRAQGRWADAAFAYERAAATYGPALAARAALAAAEVRFRRLDDPVGATRTLSAYGNGAEPEVAARIERLRAAMRGPAAARALDSP